VFVAASEDPLACLLDLQQQDPGLTDSYNPSSLDVLDHPLMLTDEVRSVLAVLAPWLAQQQPFLLVSAQPMLLHDDVFTTFHVTFFT
jgi:hypothetical protein